MAEQTKAAWTRGAMRAAKAALDNIDERITFFAYEKGKQQNLEQTAEIISRETRDREMAEVLRALISKGSFPSEIYDRAEALLAEIEGQP